MVDRVTGGGRVVGTVGGVETDSGGQYEVVIVKVSIVEPVVQIVV